MPVKGEVDDLTGWQWGRASRLPCENLNDDRGNLAALGSELP